MRIYPWILGCLVYYSAGLALPTVVPDPIPCVLDLETNFFIPVVVEQGLSLYQVRQELWIPIVQSLQKKSLDVPMRMKKRTAFMVPNPIEFPMQRFQTAKILKDVLFEVFAESMKEYDVIGAPINLVFQYIFSKQLPSYIRCFGPEVNELQ